MGPIVNRVAPETKGHGVPEVLEAVTLKGGMIRSRVAAAKILVSSLTIGSGSSGGIFAPSLYMGAMFGGALSLLVREMPLTAAEPFVYCLVGMSAFFAGAA